MPAPSIIRPFHLDSQRNVMSPSKANISTIFKLTLAALVVSVASGQAVTCGPAGFRLAGGNALYPYALSLGQSYSNACNKNFVNNVGGSYVYNPARDVVIEAGGALVGINRVCDRVGGAVDIGAVSREYRTTEATSADGWNWKCVNNPNRIMTRVDTAIDGISVIVKKSGTAATCIGFLRGLSQDQLRWIYSDRTIEQLTQTGWSRASLSQGKGGTAPIWSNLHKSCGEKEINLAGRDLVGSGTTDYFRDKIFKAPGENIDLTGTRGYQNSVSDLEVIGWVAVDDAMIAFTTLAYYTQKQSLLTLVAVKNRVGDFVKPSKETIRSNEYNPLTRRLTFEVLQSSLANTRPFIEFTFSATGDGLIAATGYDTVPAADQLLMLSRIGSPTRGVSLSGISCETNGVIRVGGNSALRPHFNVWGLFYTAKCPGVDVTLLNVPTNPNVVSLQRACGVAAAGTNLEIATSNAKTTYATVGNDYTYKCPTTTKKLIELTMAPGLFAYVNDAAAVLPISRGLLRFALSTTGDEVLTKLGLTSNAPAVNTAMLSRVPKPGGFCFSGDSSVEVLNRGYVAMKDLSIGDKVKVAGGKFSEVYSFGHYEPDAEAPFLSIDAGLEKPLLISSKHMVFVNDKAVAASAVSVGDKLSLVSGFATVKKITEVTAAGVFAPFTKDGTIVVNSIVASSYVDLKENPFVIGGVITLDMHSIAHMAQAPHRVVCAVAPAFCASETYNNGVSVWVDAPLVASVWLFKQHPAVLTAAFLPVLSFILLAASAEALFTNPILLVIAVVATLLTTRKHKKSA
ncbi:TIGRFAM phosphate binding protein [Fragilaria crotonensis]|nr:TIGRFAM phosphate binding protein [Fragilaria crotonensis]